MSLKKTLVLGAATLMAAVGVANAQNVYVAVANGTWNDAARWQRISGADPDAYPVAGDTAIINGFSISVDSGNSAATVLYIANGGFVGVTPGDVLSIQDGYMENTTSAMDIDGTLALIGKFEIKAGVVGVDSGGIFQMNGGTLKVDVTNGLQLLTSTSTLEVTADATIEGPGSILGQDQNAAVLINVQTGASVDLTLTSGVALHGTLTVARIGAGGGVGSFTNFAHVIADDSGDAILFDASLNPMTDSLNGCLDTWVATSGGTLQFDADANLDGNIFINSGSFLVCNGAFAANNWVHGPGNLGGCAVLQNPNGCP